MMPSPAVSHEFADCTALVVDDTPANRNLVAFFLKAMGVGRIETAADGLDALERTAAIRPDIIVLDVMMPRMDGFEFLQRLRATPAFTGIPVLVATALDRPKDMAMAFDCGASDYIRKPIDRREMVARIGVHLRNRQLVRRLTAYHDRVRQDLRAATAMQAALLPSEEQMAHLHRRYGVALAAAIHPSTEVSGDLWGWLPLDADRFAIWLADFSGHGVAAAINTFRLHVILDSGPSSDPAATLSRLNATLESVLPRGQFATMLYVVCDPGAGTLVFSSAGAPAPVVRRSGEAAELHPVSSLPLGIRAATAYHNTTLAFPKGSVLLLYSDGLSEALDREGRSLGEDGVLALSERISAPDGLDAAIDGLKQAGYLFGDDLSAVWVAS